MSAFSLLKHSMRWMSAFFLRWQLWENIHFDHSRSLQVWITQLLPEWTSPINSQSITSCLTPLYAVCRDIGRRSSLWTRYEILEKYPTLFSLRKPRRFQWSALARGDLEPSYACVIFFSRPSIASVDGKQHLSVVVFSALVEFSLQGKWRNNLVSRSYPYTQDSSAVVLIMVFMKTGSLFVESSMSWGYRYDPET